MEKGAINMDGYWAVIFGILLFVGTVIYIFLKEEKRKAAEAEITKRLEDAGALFVTEAGYMAHYEHAIRHGKMEYNFEKELNILKAARFRASPVKCPICEEYAEFFFIKPTKTQRFPDTVTCSACFRDSKIEEFLELSEKSS